MRTDGAPESENVEDRRGMKKAGIAAAGGGGILLVILGLVFGVDLRKFAGGPAAGPGQQQGAPPADGYKKFASRILGMTEEVWDEQFKVNGYGRYRKPKMVLFSDEVDTDGCGRAPSAVGPFYCPADDTVYLDPTFFAELEKLGGSKAEFSQAYVIAHEVGHHIQNQFPPGRGKSYSDLTNAKRKGRQENEYSIRLELQADYLAGVWAHYADKKYKILEKGDVEEALKTARSIGDNRIQEKVKGRSWPESFNHGTDRQRYAAFKKGYESGDATKARLDAFFDEAATPFDKSSAELRNRDIFGR